MEYSYFPAFTCDLYCTNVSHLSQRQGIGLGWPLDEQQLLSINPLSLSKGKKRGINLLKITIK